MIRFDPSIRHAPRCPESEPRTKIDVRWLGVSDHRLPARTVPSIGFRRAGGLRPTTRVVSEDGQRALGHARVAVVGLGG